MVSRRDRVTDPQTRGGRSQEPSLGALAGSRPVLLEGRSPTVGTGLALEKTETRGCRREHMGSEPPPQAHAPREFVCVSHRERPGVPVRSEEKGKERG